MAKLETQFVTIDGVKTRYAVAGQGFPVMLIHGYPETLQDWYQIVPQLAQKFRVYAIDLPGMGKTTGAPKTSLTPTGMANFVVKFFDHFQIQKAHVVGHDIGVGPALALAIYHQNRVAKLAFGSGGSTGLGAPSSPIQRLILRKPWGEVLVSTLPKLAFCWAYLRGSGFTKMPQRQVFMDLLADATSKENRMRGLEIYRTFNEQNPSLVTKAHKIQAPTLIFWGDKDPFARENNADKLKNLIPNATVIIFKGGKHFLMHDRPAELSNALLNFLGS